MGQKAQKRSKTENVQKLRKLDSILKRSVTRQLDSNSEIKKKSLHSVPKMLRNVQKL